jgi:beta-N-acetylglucosaminidase
MEILNHYINTVKPRTFYATQWGIYAYAENDYSRGGRFISTIEYKTADEALLAGLEWLDQCEQKRTQADFRILKVRVYPHWHATVYYLEFLGHDEEMMVRALTLREEALKGVAA